MNKPAWPHLPVMLTEVTEALQIQPGEWYIDATVGAGGHSEAILQKGGRVIAIDQDADALAIAQRRLSGKDIIFIHGNFGDLTTLVKPYPYAYAGILFDLGVSSMHFDSNTRGFSFQTDAPLDMRMNPATGGTTASEIINTLSEGELYGLFTRLAQEQRARAISQAIVRARQISPITTSSELVKVIESVVGESQGKLHPATKVFQALRIAVNDELTAIIKVLPQAMNVLKPGGILAVISFHEGEDRLVKRFMKKSSAITPSDAEVSYNPRSRSARLRVLTKI